MILLTADFDGWLMNIKLSDCYLSYHDV